MEKETFTQLVLEAESTLFHVSFSLLHNEQDCADVVQEAVLKAYAGRSRQSTRTKSLLFCLIEMDKLSVSHMELHPLL